jgi:adenylate kinase family enzyme
MTSERIAIVGCSGVGKSTLARAASERLGLPHLELDSVFHQAGWTQLSESAFRQRVSDYLDTHATWVIDGNYAPVRDLIWSQATDVVWLHPPRWRMMRQIIGRSIRRTVTREELWNGNREPWGNLTSLRPERSVIAWAFTRHPLYEVEFSQWQADPQWAHARHHKFVTHMQAQQWLAGLAG